jgi:hypothetical protein
MSRLVPRPKQQTVGCWEPAFLPMQMSYYILKSAPIIVYMHYDDSHVATIPQFWHWHAQVIQIQCTKLQQFHLSGLLLGFSLGNVDNCKRYIRPVSQLIHLNRIRIAVEHRISHGYMFRYISIAPTALCRWGRSRGLRAKIPFVKKRTYQGVDFAWACLLCRCRARQGCRGSDGTGPWTWSHWFCDYAWSWRLQGKTLAYWTTKACYRPYVQEASFRRQISINCLMSETSVGMVGGLKENDCACQERVRREGMRTIVFSVSRITTSAGSEDVCSY